MFYASNLFSIIVCTLTMRCQSPTSEIKLKYINIEASYTKLLNENDVLFAHKINSLRSLRVLFPRAFIIYHTKTEDHFD